MLAGASTPECFTVWKWGGGTLVASLHESESGSMSTATVLGDGRTKDAAQERFAAGCVEPSCARGGVQREAVERGGSGSPVVRGGEMARARHGLADASTPAYLLRSLS